MASWDEFEKRRAKSAVDSTERNVLAENFARLFESHDGKKVLQYLRKVTKERAHGPGISESALQHFAGQAYVVDHIEALRDLGIAQALKSKPKAKAKK